MNKKFLTRSLVLGCLASTALGIATLKAKEPSLYFYPSEKWDVSSSKDKDSCTLYSEFNNGYIVQFWGNADGFSSLSVDFRQDTFEKGKSYDVRLSVPGAAESTVSSKATKSNLILADLGGHPDLSRALIKASVLDLEIEDNAFRFYMTGLNTALKDYQQCAGKEIARVPDDPDIALEDQKMAASITPIPLQPKDTPDVKIKEAPEKAVAARPDADRIILTPPDPKPSDAKPTELQQKMAALAENDTAPEKTKSVSVDNPETGARPRVSKKQDDKKPALQKENVKPEKPAEKIEIAKPAPAPEPKQEPEKPKLPPKTETIKTPPMKITREKPARMEADFTKLGLEEDKQKDKPREIPPIQEARDVKPNAAYPVEDFKDMRNKIKELEQQVIRLESENKNLDGDLKQALQDAREERLSVSSDNWNLESATMKFNESERQVERLGRQIQTLKSQCELEKRELEGMLFDPKVTDQQQLAKLAALEAELEQTKADILMQKRSYEERIQLLEERLGR